MKRLQKAKVAKQAKVVKTPMDAFQIVAHVMGCPEYREFFDWFRTGWQAPLASIYAGTDIPLVDCPRCAGKVYENGHIVGVHLEAAHKSSCESSVAFYAMRYVNGGIVPDECPFACLDVGKERNAREAYEYLREQFHDPYEPTDAEMVQVMRDGPRCKRHQREREGK